MSLKETRSKTGKQKQKKPKPLSRANKSNSQLVSGKKIMTSNLPQNTKKHPSNPSVRPSARPPRSAHAHAHAHALHEGRKKPPASKQQKHTQKQSFFEQQRARLRQATMRSYNSTAPTDSAWRFDTQTHNRQHIHREGSHTLICSARYIHPTATEKKGSSCLVFLPPAPTSAPPPYLPPIHATSVHRIPRAQEKRDESLPSLACLPYFETWNEKRGWEKKQKNQQKQHGLAFGYLLKQAFLFVNHTILHEYWQPTQPQPPP